MTLNSLLDTDYYTFTQMQVVLHRYPSVNVKYSFKWRNFDKMKFSISMSDFLNKLNLELDHLCTLRFEEMELRYFESRTYFTQDLIDFLRLFKLNRKYINARVKKGCLFIDIEGPWLHTIPFEVPVLAIVSQLYTENNDVSVVESSAEAARLLNEKLDMLEETLDTNEDFQFADFGTRRRMSLAFQEEMIRTILSRKSSKYFIGSSNVMLALKYGIKVIGTMSHQLLQAHQQLGPRLIDSQKAALQSWADEYRGELGIALSDVIGFDAFLKDFDRYFALLFDGCRHDSGDPSVWCTKLIKHYRGLRIDPKTKYAVFSDGLNFQTAIHLFRTFHSRINTSFGIGTYLTNDCGFIAPQIVIKMVECNGGPVAKVSDSVGKGMCEDPEFEKYLQNVIATKLSR